MGNRKRKESSTGVYHVFARGINHELIFRQIREKNYFKRIIVKALEKHQLQIYAYCIMPNHVHFIIKSNTVQELSYFMASVLSEYAKYYNYKKNRNGHVFQNRYGSDCIEDANYFWNCLRYVHRNPVKARLVKNISDYAYGSVGDYEKKTSKIVSKEAFELVEERFPELKGFYEFHQEKSGFVFKGMEDEVFGQQMEAAWICLLEYQRKVALHNTKEILEIKEHRDAFKIVLQEKLEVSKNLVNKIYKEIKKELLK